MKKMYDEVSSYLRVIGIMLICIGSAGLVFATQMGDVSATVEAVLGTCFGIALTVGVALLAALETFVKKLDELTAEMIDKLEEAIEELEDEVEELEAENAELAKEIDDLKDDRIEELEKEVEELESAEE
jgi:peptidoglycan hydrolase CwlO-like protein